MPSLRTGPALPLRHVWPLVMEAPARVWRRPIGRTWLLVAAAATLLVLGVAVWLAQRAAPAPPAPPETAPTRLVARGQVRPVGQARVATLTGGTITRLAVAVGDTVEEEQEIARVRGPNGTEVLTAPWRGTVTTVPVHLGDTVLPGTTLVTIGDLSRLQVETTDVDEFLIAHLYPGQLLTLTVDALDGREVLARVRSVALELQPGEVPGDQHYPVILDLVDPPPQLRAGMTVRLELPAR